MYSSYPILGNTLRGKKVIEEKWAPYKEAVFLIKDLERIETRISGNIAYTVNQYYYTYPYPDQEEIWYKTKNVPIWQKQQDGSWKLHLDIWNSCGTSN
jgi:ketosteroid isomerase-like protein